MFGRRFVERRAVAWLLSLAVLACSAVAVARSPAGSDGYATYSIGELTAPRPDPVRPGLVLVGGGEWPRDAFLWMIERAGHGHIVILSASGTTEEQDKFYKDLGGIASAQTFVFRDRKAASDPKVLAAVDKADGIFIAGGDQANYVRYWKDTPLNEAIDRHVREGKPIGGTSAGLAILGAWAYGAMDGGSITSDVAMRDPLGKGMTLEHDFLHLPYLQHVITDSHFGKRDRLGRLIAFLANLRRQGAADVVGLGIDEGAALCIDGEGVGRVFPGQHGYAWLVQPTQPPARVEPGQSLDYAEVRITGVGPDSRLHLQDFSVDAPAFLKVGDVRDGQLVLRDAQAGSHAGIP
jgi:cyanophycinase